MPKYLFLFSLAALLSLLVTPAVRWLAFRVGAIDMPGERRIHSHPTPRLGGVAIYAALMITLSVGIFLEQYGGLRFPHTQRLIGLVAGASAVMLLGVFDDVRSLSPALKLFVQILAASIVVLSGSSIDRVLTFDVGLWDVPLTIFWVVAITNAFNLIDGLDGLAAGVGLIVTTTLFAIFMYLGKTREALILAPLGGALLGFLRYNFYPAKIFLGDSGSLLLGFVLAVVAIEGSSKISTTIAILVPILALGVPIIDTALAILRRLLQGLHVVRHDEEKERYEFLFVGKAALFTADQRHIHHRLLDLGITHRNSVLVLYGICLLFGFGAFAVVVQLAPDTALLLAAFSLAAVIGINRLDYGEMHVLRRGALLPIFELPLVNRRIFHVLFDLVSIIVAYWLAHLVWYEFAWSGMVRFRFYRALPLVAFAQIGAFVLAGLYRRSFRHSGIADLLTVSRALMIAVAAAWIARLFVNDFENPSVGLTVLDGYLLATAVIGSRVSFQVLDYLFKTDKDGQRRVLIYGAGNGGLFALREIQNNPALDMKTIGFLDDDAGKRDRVLHGLPVRSVSEIEQLVNDRAFDELIVASRKIPEDRVRDVAERCGLAGIPVRRFSIGWDEWQESADRARGNRPALAS